MPAIFRGSSIRSRRNQVPEDNIEDGDPSQRSRTDDVEEVEDSEEQSTRISRKKSVKSSPSKRKRAKKPARSHEEGNESPEESQQAGSNLPIDLEHFPDQPLEKGAAKVISNFASEWESTKRNMRNTTLQVIEQVAIALAEAGENRDGKEALQELEQSDTLMRDLLGLQAELSAHEDTLTVIANNVALGEEMDNIIQQYTAGVEDRKEAWQMKTTRQKYAKDDDYVKFKSSIYEVQHPDEGMPPLTSLIPAEEGEDSDDEEIAVGGVSQVYTCPLTLRILEKPMTSQICKHSFSKSSIEEYLGNNRSMKRKCPAAGCSKMICLSVFKPNPDLEKRVLAHQRREQRRQAEADSGDEAVEEIID